MSEAPQTQLYFDKAQEACQKENFPYAFELLDEVLAEEPSHAQARLMLQSIRERIAQGNPAKGMAKMAASLKSAPQLAQAALHTNRKDWAKAAAAYEAVLRANPTHEGALHQHGKVLLELDCVNAAVAVWEFLLKTNPDHMDTLRQLAALYLRTANSSKAHDAFERILKSNPNDGEARRGLKDLDAIGTLERGFGGPTQKSE
ncbi:MAG: hypothetical protein JW937_07255 [Candidatus Omnitrophica bacterium]|nr:hypothetical protein [Candidatus Omnitrophota bacterium]